MTEWSYGNPGNVTSEVATVRAIYDAFARRDLEAALLLMAEDIELSLQGTGERVGRDRPYRGVAGVREYFADAQTIWDELTLRADDIRAAPGHVIVFGHAEGRVGEERVHRAVMWTWKVRDGLATYVRANDVGPV